MTLVFKPFQRVVILTRCWEVTVQEPIPSKRRASGVFNAEMFRPTRPVTRQVFLTGTVENETAALDGEERVEQNIDEQKEGYNNLFAVSLDAPSIAFLRTVNPFIPEIALRKALPLRVIQEVGAGYKVHRVMVSSPHLSEREKLRRMLELPEFAGPQAEAILEKLRHVSSKPQLDRNRLRTILNKDERQMVHDLVASAHYQLKGAFFNSLPEVAQKRLAKKWGTYSKKDLHEVSERWDGVVPPELLKKRNPVKWIAPNATSESHVTAVPTVRYPHRRQG